jgi:PAS domain S-box-containing protein
MSDGPRAGSVARPLILATVLFGVVITLLTTAIQLYVDYRAEVKALHERLAEIPAGRLESLATSLWTVDEPLIRLQVNGVLKIPDVTFVELRQEDGGTLTVGKIPDGDTVTREFPLSVPYHGVQKDLGVLRVVAGLDGIYQRLASKAVGILVSFAILISAVGGFLFFLFRRMVTRHLDALARYTATLTHAGDAEPFILERPGILERSGRNPGEGDELDQISGAINTLRERLVESAEDLRRNEERLNAITHHSPAAIFLKDREGRHLMVNARCEEWLGRPRAEILGRTVFDIFQPAEAEAFARLDREILESGAVQENVIEARYPDGVTRTLLAVRFPIHDAAGGVTGIGSINVDITARRKAEKEAAEAHERLVQAVESMADGFVLLDADGRLVICNQQFRDLHPGVADLLESGMHFEDVIRAAATRGWVKDAKGREEEWIRERLERHRNPGEPFTVQFGGDTWLRVTERLTADGGNVSIRADVTDHVLREKALRHAKEEVELAHRAKAEFLTNMTHELRTPLNAIIGFSDVISKETFDPLETPEYREYARDINESGNHLLSLINDVLDISRVELGAMPLRKTLVDVPRLLGSCERFVRERAARGALTLDVEVGEPIPDFHADERRVKQILINLLSNAIKFTPAGGSVRVSGNVTNSEEAVFRVVDTGIGMSPEDVEKALSVFGQADGSLARNYEGAGLGLPLARHLAETHGGTLRVDSVPGAGTTVTVRLPLQ